MNAFLLVLIGIIALYASSAMKGSELYGDPFFFLKKQVFAVIVGLALVFLIKVLPFKFIERLVLPLLLISILLLFGIFIPGAYKTVGGASRWFNLGFAYIQPAELAKISLVLFLAKNLSRESSDVTNFFSGILPNILVLLVLSFLLMLQPDFGTTILLFAVTLAMIFVAGSKVRFIAISIFSSAAVAFLAIISEPYRLKRLVSFIDPWADFKAGGFQIIQSYLAFQNGGLFGLGLGESRQKLFFLPEAHTDFIFSVIGEEMGLFGTLIVCLLFYNLISTGFMIGQKTLDPFKKLLAFGMTCLIGFQTLFNLGVVMGTLPTKGISLPFISSGVSSLLSYFFIISVLARIGQEVPSIEERRQE